MLIVELDTYLAEARHRVGCERRLVADRAPEDGKGVDHVGARLVRVAELLVRLAHRHVRLRNNRRVELHMVLGSAAHATSAQRARAVDPERAGRALR